MFCLKGGAELRNLKPSQLKREPQQSGIKTKVCSYVYGIFISMSMRVLAPVGACGCVINILFAIAIGYSLRMR